MTRDRCASTATRAVLAALLGVASFTVATGAVAASAATPSTCRSNQLDIAFASGGAGLGHVALLIRFTNVSRRSCKLSGYPTIQLHDATGPTAMNAIRTQNGYLGGLGQTSAKRALPLVTLKARTGVASVMVEGTDNPVGSATSCVTLMKLALTLPGQKLSLHFITSFPGCSVPEVHPFVKGPTGRMG
jgi:hypothetical protein